MRSNNKSLSIALIILLLMNIVLVVFIWKGNKNNPPKRSSGANSSLEILDRELQLSDSQKTAYQNLRNEYSSISKPVFDSIRELRKSFLEMIKDSGLNDSSLSDYSIRVAAKQAAIDRMSLEHFRKVRALFKDDQLRKYDSFIRKAMLRNRDSSNKK